MERGYLYNLLRELGLGEFAAETLEFLLVRPLKIALILLAALLASRLGGRAMRRFVRGVHARAPLLASSVRAEQRAGTVGEALAGLVKVVVWAVAVLLVLDQVGVSLAPLLAGAGIAGLAIGFGAQTLVRDFISGMFILLEDQYGVGDQVEVSGRTGTVEDVSLRITRVRDVDGKVWFVPNGEVRTVGNASMEWSRAVLDVPVAAGVELDAVRALVEEEATAMAADERWAAAMLEPPSVWGVETLAADTLTLRVVVKTAPREHDNVARELRARIGVGLRRLRQPGAA